jgi:hypothetical protein
MDLLEQSEVWQDMIEGQRRNAWLHAELAAQVSLARLRLEEYEALLARLRSKLAEPWPRDSK